MTKKELKSELLTLRSAIDAVLLGMAEKPARRKAIEEPMISYTVGKWSKPRSLRKT